MFKEPCWLPLQSTNVATRTIWPMWPSSARERPAISRDSRTTLGAGPAPRQYDPAMVSGKSPSSRSLKGPRELDVEPPRPVTSAVTARPRDGAAGVFGRGHLRGPSRELLGFDAGPSLHLHQAGARRRVRVASTMRSRFGLSAALDHLRG